MPPALKMEEGAMNQVMGWPLEAGKGKAQSAAEPPEGTHFCGPT